MKAPSPASPVDFREDNEEIGESAVGDPHLLAVQREAAVRLPRCARLCAERIRARSRLAERIRPNQLPAHEARKVLSFLRVGAEADQRSDGEAGLSAERRGKRRAAADGLADEH